MKKEKSEPALSKMKIFLSIQEMFKVLGIYRPSAFGNFNPVNLRNAGFFILFLLFSICTILYMVFECQTFGEYSESLLGVAVGLSLIGGSIVFISKTKPMFELIDNFETAIAQREYLEALAKILVFDFALKW